MSKTKILINFVGVYPCCVQGYTVETSKEIPAAKRGQDGGNRAKPPVHRLIDARSIRLGVWQLQLKGLTIGGKGDRPGRNGMHTPLVIDVLAKQESLAVLGIYRNQCTAPAGGSGNHTQELEAFLDIR